MTQLGQCSLSSLFFSQQHLFALFAVLTPISVTDVTDMF